MNPHFKMTCVTIFEKQYDGNSLCDMNRDLHEALNPEFNDKAERLEMDEHYMVKGTITVTMRYDPEG